MRRTLVPAVLVAGLAVSAAADPSQPHTFYELRVYKANAGKLDEIHARVKEASQKLMPKHGITPVAFFVPPGENKDNKLVLLFSYPSSDAREKAWKNYYGDADARKLSEDSQKEGPLEAKADQWLMTTTDYSPVLKVEAKGDRVFELRTYKATKGNLPGLNARFRDHTLKLFEKHGMQNVVYWNMAKGEPGEDTALVYLLAHKSQDAAKKSFDAFRLDPDWIAARKASEDKGNGSLTEAKGGVVSEFLVPTEYSPLK